MCDLYGASLKTDASDGFSTPYISLRRFKFEYGISILRINEDFELGASLLAAKGDNPNVAV